MKQGNVQLLSEYDVEITHERISEQVDFRHLQPNAMLAVCRRLGMKCEYLNIIPTVEEMKTPNHTRKITAVGNCFFRSLSYALSGTERNYTLVKFEILKYLKCNESVQ